MRDVLARGLAGGSDAKAIDHIVQTGLKTKIESFVIAHGLLGDRVFNVPCELAFTEPVEKSRTLFFFQLCTVLAAAVSLDHRFPCPKPVLRRLRLRKDIRP